MKEARHEEGRRFGVAVRRKSNRGGAIVVNVDAASQEIVFDILYYILDFPLGFGIGFAAKIQFKSPVLSILSEGFC